MLASPDYIFWDWHGVLGYRGFWHKSSKTNPEIANFTNYAFATHERVESWMRGTTTFKFLLAASGAEMSLEELLHTFLQDIMDADAVNITLLNTVQQLYPLAKHYLVTDNMDIFNDYLARCQGMSDRFSAIFNSTDYGVLKSDVPGLFHIVQQKLGLSTYESCLLIDDSPINCQRFESLGGSSINVRRSAP